MLPTKDIFENIESWPVAQASSNRKRFIEELNAFVMTRLLESNKNQLSELISKTIYLEKQRIKLNPWKVDPVDDKAYWNNISNTLELIQSLGDKENAEKELLNKIVNRYSEEIVGHFDVKTFRFSRWFLTTFFKRLFNKYFGQKQWRWGNKKHLLDKIKVTGDISKIQHLFAKGIVVILPTHHSNLDSIMVGYAIDTKMHLPVFSYGAGLNLYNVEIAAYFMNRLGAFRVDRRKKNPIYLECLKGMTSYSLLKGINNIFFPGGTRSRSGATESKVKLGLIGSLVEAQRLNIESGINKKIFIVTMNINYHFVLEAKALIDQYLRQIGREKHAIQKDGGPNLFTYLSFYQKLLKTESDVHLSLGRVMDVFGNNVDEDGQSIDKFGHVVALEDYFMTEGQIKADPQRESIYTRLLGEYVVKEYSKNQVVLSSNIIAFTAFQYFYAEYTNLDVVSFINTKIQQQQVAYDVFRDRCSEVVDVVRGWAGEGAILLSGEVKNMNTDELIEHGLRHLGVYHDKKVLRLDGKFLKTDDIALLFFYHNRLTNYPFHETLPWVHKIQVD